MSDYKNALKQMILLLNYEKPFETMDIDNEDFINFVCKKTGLNKKDYYSIMGLKVKDDRSYYLANNCNTSLRLRHVLLIKAEDMEDAKKLLNQYLCGFYCYYHEQMTQYYPEKQDGWILVVSALDEIEDMDFTHKTVIQSPEYEADRVLYLEDLFNTRDAAIDETREEASPNELELEERD